MLNKPEYVLDLILQSSHILLWWHLCTSKQKEAFSQSASWGSHLEWFSYSLEGAPRGVEHLLAHFPFTPRSNSSQTISIGFRSSNCGGQVTDAALHHSLSWSNSPHIVWRCVWGDCPVNGITKRKPDGMTCPSGTLASIKCALDFE